MNQNIVTYLNENKEKYPKGVLVAELQKSGYAEGDIAEGVAEVFEGKAPAVAPVVETSFWNFKDKKVYTSARQKWADFLFGVFAPTFFGFIVMITFGFVLYLTPLIAPLFFLLWVVAMVYLFSRRRFIFYGMIIFFVILPIANFILISAMYGRHGF